MTFNAAHFKKYISLGMSVFPVNLTRVNGKVEKKPAVEWQDYQQRMATDDEINVWCSMLTFNAIGMATGKISGVTVLDLDDPTIKDFDSSVKVKTISGGYHLWYKYKPGVRNMARINGKLMDVRGDGGFVVLPPSGISVTERYTWESYEFDNMPEFPTLVQVKKQYIPTMTELPTASEGNRNQTAIQVAGHMVHQTKKQAWETTAWEAFKNWNQTMVTPPIDEYELRRTFDSACRMESVNHPDKKERIYVHFGDQIQTRYKQMMAKWGSGMTTGYEKLDEYFKLVPEQLYLISAPTHHGKTTLALNIASKVATLGSRVLFASMEQGIFIAPRIESALGGKTPDTLGILSSDVLLKTQDLLDTVGSLPNPVDLLVIDHLHFMEKNDNLGVTGGIDRMMLDVQNAAKTMSIPVIVISHLRKLNENREPVLDDLRDSSSLAQIPSVVIQLYVETDPETAKLKETGSLLIRKNRITGKLGKLSFTTRDTGEIVISDFQRKVMTI